MYSDEDGLDSEEEDDIEEEDTCAVDHQLPLYVLPLYSMLSTEHQTKV